VGLALSLSFSLSFSLSLSLSLSLSFSFSFSFSFSLRVAHPTAVAGIAVRIWPLVSFSSALTFMMTV
jgi:hypothetical protein